MVFDYRLSHIDTIGDSVLIAIGDIHGCDEALSILLHEFTSRSNSCIFLGDYLDRGPSSINVIDQLIKAKAARPDWIFLTGNHEQMLVDSLRSNIAPIGDNTAYDQYGAIGGVPPDHKAFLDSLLPWWESERFLFVHGGIEKYPHLPIGEHEVEELVWTYLISNEWAGKTIVRGHLIVDQPKQHDNYIDLDTGCCCAPEGWLTAGILDDSSGKLVGYFQVSTSGNKERFIQL